MNAVDLNRIEGLLLEARERTLRSLGQLRHQVEDMTPASLDHTVFPIQPVEAGTETLSHDQAIAIAAQESRYLDGITRALERLHEHPESFGRCQTCGREIPLERLEVVPHTRFCVECKAQLGEAA